MISDTLVSFLAAISRGINGLFGPVLKPVFHPIDAVLSSFYMPYAQLVAIGYFVGTMVWVFVGLRREYVNIEAPSKHVWHDLRFWTIVSMLPHIVVYFYFSGR